MDFISKMLGVRNRNQEKFDKEVDALEIKPSETIKSIKGAFDSVCSTTSVVSNAQSRVQSLHDAMDKIAESYGQSFQHDSYPQQDKGKFSVSYEYTEGNRTKTASVNNVDKETAMKIYSDMYHIGEEIPKITYRDEEEHEPDWTGNIDDTHTASNVSVGVLRRSYFDLWNVPNDDSHNAIKGLGE